MKLSVFAVALGHLPLEEACAFLHKHGVDAVEIGCGGNPGKQHCDPVELLASPAKLEAFKDVFKRNEIEIGALSTHDNAVHPNKDYAKRAHEDFVNACRLAEKLGINRVVTFSGCPGGSPDDKTPNWATCSWPTDFMDILKYQWEDVLIPYWKEAAKMAANHGVTRIALELHPGFCVYNPHTMHRLADAVGTGNLGANLDPSHLFWQGIDPVAAIRDLGKLIFYFHAKDTSIDPYNTAVNGVLDTKHYADPKRSWLFRTVGYGHDTLTWNRIISELRKTGYDDVLSIEHEDAVMSGEEGLRKAIRFMQNVLIYEPAGEMFWA